MELNERLKELRKRWKLSQKEMAGRLEVATSTYQYYERGERGVPSQVLQKITSFGVTPTWLLIGEGEVFAGKGHANIVRQSGSGNVTNGGISGSNIAGNSTILQHNGPVSVVKKGGGGTEDGEDKTLLAMGMLTRIMGSGNPLLINAAMTQLENLVKMIEGMGKGE